MDEHSNQLTPTYPKRAKQIVKQGRAEWVDENTIRMLAGSPVETRAETVTKTQELLDYLRCYIEKAISEQTVGIDSAIKAISHVEDADPDEKVAALKEIAIATQNTKAQLISSLASMFSIALKYEQISSEAEQQQ